MQHSPEIETRGNEETTAGRFRVAIVTASLGLAGAEKQAFYIARALAEAGIDVRVFNLSRGGEYEDALRQMHVTSRSFGWLPGLPLRLVLLLTALRRFRPHVVQSVHAYTNAYSAIAGKVLGALSIGGLRSDFKACFADNGRFSRFLLTWPDAIAVNSKRALEQVKQTPGLLHPGRLHYLPNAIDLESFPARPETPDQWTKAGCTCICVSRLFPAKRVDVFVRALAAARSRAPELRGVIVGHGPESARLRQLALELGLIPDALTFLGFRDDVAALLQRAAVFVFCSESEGTPNVILEAMAAALPVITTPAGDAAEVVGPARAGYVVPFGDVKATADAMAQLAGSPGLRSQLGRAGRNYVVRHRATSELSTRVLKIYADVARTCCRDDLLQHIPGAAKETRAMSSQNQFPLKQSYLKPSILRRLMIRAAGGFVIAVHDMPPYLLAQFIDGLWPARPVPLADLVKRKIEQKSTSGLFAITVDDGVGDNLRGLVQLFRSRAWPATFYLPTRYLDTSEAMAFQWWWRLKPLLPRKKLPLRSGMLDLSLPGAAEALSRKIERMWYSERLETYLPLTLELVEVVCRELGTTIPELQGPVAPITWREVAEISRDDLIHFESHGVTHTALSALTEEEIAFEMRHSQNVLEQHTGRPCRHFCYPFGSPLSIGRLAPMLAQRFYDSAVTMSLGSVDRADPWLLPRIPLYAKNSVLFARMKILLKCTSLSPSMARSKTLGASRAIEK